MIVLVMNDLIARYESIVGEHRDHLILKRQDQVPRLVASPLPQPPMPDERRTRSGAVALRRPHGLSVLRMNTMIWQDLLDLEQHPALTLICIAHYFIPPCASDRRCLRQRSAV